MLNKFPGSQWSYRVFLLFVGLFLLVAGALAIAHLSAMSVLETQDILSYYWRTTYDLLVRPMHAQSQIEQTYHVVEANFLTRLTGGITFAQYQAVLDIPGVEVAAPIVTLGYLNETFDTTTLKAPTTPGVYTFESQLGVNRGAYHWKNSGRYYSYVGPVTAQERNQRILGVYINNPGIVVGHPTVPLLWAAIDPEQEAALVGLEHAVVAGQYLSHEALRKRTIQGPEGQSQTVIEAVPVLINATPYVNFTSTVRIGRVQIPLDSFSISAIQKAGGAKFLDTLPVSDVLTEHTIQSTQAYSQLIERFWGTREANVTRIYTLYEYPQPTVRAYQVISPPVGYAELTLALAGTPEWAGNPIQTVSTGFTLKAVGIFDIDRIPRPADVNRVPLETYFPPIARLSYTVDGVKLDPTMLLLPTLWPEYNVPSPPLLLTTLEAARLIAGDACISAIRVRVSDVETLSMDAQHKVEAIATEIRRRTGLDVDIMIGASPTFVLVKQPEIGYVEENWIQKGIALIYRQKIQSGHLVLLIALLVMGGIFVFDLVWAGVAAEKSVLALQKAVGWRPTTLMRQVIQRVLFISGCATVLGIIGELGVSQLFKWGLPPWRLILEVAVATVSLAVLGSLYPAWYAGHIPPVSLLKGAQTPYQRQVKYCIQTLWHYSFHGLFRRQSRAILNCLAAALAAALLVLFLLITIEQRGYLGGTLLGKYIAGNIAGYHYALVGIGFGLTGLSIANGVLANVLERRREIGLLKAVGWQTPAIAHLFVSEGSLLGGLGGLVGSVVGAYVFWGLYHQIAAISLGWVFCVGVATPTVVGALAAGYPAHIAANILPIESLQQE
ncbi:MAG: ABC transporter permease [Anaerolineae bacterium]